MTVVFHQFRFDDVTAAILESVSSLAGRLRKRDYANLTHVSGMRTCLQSRKGSLVVDVVRRCLHTVWRASASVHEIQS